MTKYTKTIANTPEAERTNALKSLKTSAKKHTGFGYVQDPSKTMPIDPDKTAGYSSEVIALAQQLKYQYEHDSAGSNGENSKFNDEFYLEYAQRQIRMKNNSMFDGVWGGIDDVPDPAYAQYSYEEIIAMANNGVNIPKAVLAWAKGQQEADVVDYVVISDNVDYIDEHSQDNQKGESEISKIRAEVKDNALKAKKAQEDITRNREKTSELKNQANSIAKEQKNIFKNNSIDKTEQMVKEWKKLDKKKKNEGKLDSSENAKYKKLTEKLSKNGQIIQDMQKKTLDLDGFLDSIDNLNTETNEGIITAHKTISSANLLSDLDDRLNIFFRVHAYTIADRSSGMLENTLGNLDDFQLAIVSDKIGHDLEDIGNDTLNMIRDEETQETVKFANTFINKATHIENVLGIDKENDSNEDGIKKEDKLEKEDNFQGSNTIAKGMNNMFNNNESSDSDNPFGFLFSFMSNPQVAAMFTLATALSTRFTIAESTVLNAESIVLGTLASKEKKEDEKLEKTASESVETFETNSQIISENEEKLLELDEKSNAQNSQPKGTQVFLPNDKEQNISNINMPEQNKNPEIESERSSLNNENEILKNENRSLQDKVKEPLDTSAKSLSKSKKYLKDIRSNNETLAADTKELNKLSGNTAQIAAESLRAGMTNLAISVGLYASGMAMLPNLATHAMGLFLIKTATAWDLTGSLQTAGGIAATAATVEGMVGTEISNAQSTLTKSIVGVVTRDNKNSQTLINETAKAMGGLNVPDTIQENTTNRNSNSDNIELNDNLADESTNNNVEGIINIPQEKEMSSSVQGEPKSDADSVMPIEKEKTQSVLTSEGEKPKENKEKSDIFAVSTTEKSTTKDINGNKNIVSEDNKPQEENISNNQSSIKSSYGSNQDYVAMVVTNNIVELIGLGPTSFVFNLVKVAAIVGLSVLDLFNKKSVVDQSREQAEKDVNNANDVTKSLEAKSNEIKSQHDKNIEQSKALSNDYKSLNDDTIDSQSGSIQKQSLLVEKGKISPEDTIEFSDPNESTKNAIRSNINRISEGDSKLLSTISQPATKAEKSMKISHNSTNSFQDLNENLTQRNDNNDDMGDLIIAESIAAQTVITGLIATLLASGPWCWGLVGLWAVALAENAAFAATGVGAKLASDKVDGNIEDNNQSIKDNNQVMANDQKQMNDVRKIMAKAALETIYNISEQNESAQENNDKKLTQKQNNTENIDNPDLNEQIKISNNEDSFVRKSSDTRSGFDRSSLNAELDINNPNDVKKANEYAVTYERDVNDADEKSRAAASTNVTIQGDTTKADVKLSRFNKDGSIDSSKRAKKVNAASASSNGKKRR